MGIVYDPMTGEPIETPDEETTVAETNTEETTVEETATVETPVEETAAVETPVEETAATETPVEETAAVETVAEVTPEDVPVSSEEINEAAKVTYEEPINDQKNNKILYIALGVAAVLVIAVICCVVAMFSSKKAKVEKALVNTLKIDSHLAEDLTKTCDIINSKDYTLNYSVDIEDMGSAEGAFILSDSKKQIKLNADIEEFIPFTLLAQYDKNTIKAEIPEACKYVFTYNYRDEKDGFLIDELGDETVEELDKLLQYIYDYNPENDKYTKEINKLVKEYSKKLEFENAGKETFKVNGNKVNCKGISVLIENELMTDFFDDFYDIYMEQMEDSFGDLGSTVDLDIIEDEMKFLKKEVKDLPDTEITFYIYKNALACINVDTGKKNAEIEILFKGGDFRAENIVVEVDEDEIFEIKMNLKNDKETYKLFVGDNDYSISYNPKEGDVNVSYNDGYDTEEFEFNFKASNNEAVITFEDLEIPYVGEFDMEFNLAKGTSFEKFENKDEFDIGNASEDDIMDLVNDLDEDFTKEIIGLF